MISMEASGDFLRNVARVCGATGMTMEQLFEYLSNALADQRNDRMPPGVMIDGRLPDSERLDVATTMSELVSQLDDHTGRIIEGTETLKLLEVSDVDFAIIEITTPSGDAGTPVSVVHPRRRRVAAKREPGTAGDHRVVLSARSHQELHRE